VQCLNETLLHGDTNHGFDGILAIVVAPASAGKFTARLDGRELCCSTKPFLDAARVLLAEGVDPDTVIQMVHLGNNTLSLRSTVGAAAGLTILEGDLRPRFARWQAFERTAELPMAA
jgi:hypothetical protein